MIPRLIYIVLLVSVLFGQDLDLESLLEATTEGEVESSTLEYLEQLAETPLNVRRATIAELESIPWISPTEARAIAEYRRQHRIHSLEDIRPLVNPQYVYILQRFLTVQNPTRLNVRGRHRLSLLNTPTYAGGEKTPLRVYNRVKLNLGEQARGGFLLERDPGEPRWDDLAVGAAQWSGRRNRLRWTAGRFVAEAGQGLVFGRPYPIYRSADPTLLVKQHVQGVRPFLSTLENAGQRGGAAEFRFAALQGFVFASRCPRDARLENDVIQSFPQTGLHRTQTERLHADAVQETAWGGHLALARSPRLRLGVSFLQSDWGYPVKDAPKSPHQHWGVNWDWYADSLNVFGEIAILRDQPAQIHGVWLERRNFDIVFMFRQFAPNYYSSHGNAFSSTAMADESSFFLGWNYQPAAGWKVSGSLDRTLHPLQPRGRCVPNQSWLALIQVRYRFSSNHRFLIRLKIRDGWRESDVMDDFGNSFERFRPHQRQSLRFQMDLDQPPFRFRSRAEWSFSDAVPQNGFLVYQDVAFQPLPQIDIRGRWSFFDARHYDLRLYQHQVEAPGVMRCYLMYGSGSHFSGRLRWRGRHWGVAAGLGAMIWQDRPNQLPDERGASRHIHVQFDWKL